MNLAEELRSISPFSELSEKDLTWIASMMEVQSYGEGEVIVREGQAAEHLVVVLKGELRSVRETGQDDGRSYTASAGVVTGLLPYSRLTTYQLTSRAVEPTVLARLEGTHFPELLERTPGLVGKLVGIMADRIREFATQDQQRAKMAALGKLSAGLAHELNNPASAAKRAAKALRESLSSLRSANMRLEKLDLPSDQRTLLAEIDCKLNDQVPPAAIDSLERSDREERIGTWLEDQNVANAWVLAGNLVDAGVEAPELESLSDRIDPRALQDVLTRIAASFTIERLVQEIESSTVRVGELVAAVKEYSHMDRMPQQEIDVHSGIESTLVMLRHRMKEGVKLVRDYDRTLPRINAYGSELNQVWTNLIENAIDAMGGKGELQVRTCREVNGVLVEIRDNGPGIPTDIRERIFEPFFTTKPVGTGTGLGLDVVYRIVQRHRGDIRVVSEPGDTRFQVRLPFPRSSNDTGGTKKVRACGHLKQAQDLKPGRQECEDCVKTGDQWLHLRLCLTCGHVGCCDSSKNRHATKHFHSTEHPIVRSIEPGEAWGWCYADEVAYDFSKGVEHGHIIED